MALKLKTVKCRFSITTPNHVQRSAQNKREKCFMILLVHPDFFNYDLSIFQNDWLLKKKLKSALRPIKRLATHSWFSRQARLGKEINIKSLLNSIVAEASPSKLQCFVSTSIQLALYQACL